MKTFREFLLEANARLGDVSNHPLYGTNQPLQQRGITGQMQRTSQQIANQPVGNQQGAVGKPITAVSNNNKLDVNQPPAMVVNQYLSAFQQRLGSATVSQVKQMIDANAQQVGKLYGVNAANFFRQRANFMVQQNMDLNKATNNNQPLQR